MRVRVRVYLCASVCECVCVRVCECECVCVSEVIIATAPAELSSTRLILRVCQKHPSPTSSINQSDGRTLTSGTDKQTIAIAIAITLARRKPFASHFTPDPSSPAPPSTHLPLLAARCVAPACSHGPFSPPPPCCLHATHPTHPLEMWFY